MMTLEEIYEEDPTQRIIDEGADWGAKQMLKAGVPIFYRSEDYPETMVGNLFEGISKWRKIVGEKNID